MFFLINMRSLYENGQKKDQICVKKYPKITVSNDWVLTKPRLCSKLSLFKMSWWMLKVPLQLSPLDPSVPYLRSFQLGTEWPYNSRGIKNMTCQS